MFVKCKVVVSEEEHAEEGTLRPDAARSRAEAEDRSRETGAELHILARHCHVSAQMYSGVASWSVTSRV